MIDNPAAYVQANLVGFGHILEGAATTEWSILSTPAAVRCMAATRACRFRTLCVDHPVSLYAASKKANELMAHTYSHLYGLQPELALFHRIWPVGPPRYGAVPLHKAMLEGKPIQVFNNGQMVRDFTLSTTSLRARCGCSRSPRRRISL